MTLGRWAAGSWQTTRSISIVSDVSRSDQPATSAGFAARSWRPIDRRDVAHVGLELERVGNFRIAREHLCDAQDFHDPALTDSEPSHLRQVECGPEGGARSERHRKRQRLLEALRETVVLERAPDGGPHVA